MSDLSAADIESLRDLIDAVTSGLLPLSCDQASLSQMRMTGAPIEYVVADANGLEFATVRNQDEETTELIVRAINTLPALLDAADRGRALEAAVAAFINERPGYITACRAPVIRLSERDRLEGASGALRDLAQRLGWTVPSKPGEKTMPKEASGE